MSSYVLHADISTHSKPIQPVDISHTEQQVADPASFFNAIELGATDNESVNMQSQSILTTIVCGKTDLSGVADSLQICDHLGRKRLKQGDIDTGNSRLFWFLSSKVLDCEQERKVSPRLCFRNSR
jgi:hypothetical protein